MVAVATVRFIRILAAVGVLLIAGHAVGLEHLAPFDECARDCPEKERKQSADADCDTCACCPTTRIAVVTALQPAPDRQPRIVAQLDSPRPPGSPEPRDITHVPKPFA